METSGAFGKTIQLFLVGGKPSGLRKATIHGWTGSVLISDQSTFAEMLSRDELDRTGIYLLSGPDLINGSRTRVYIGAANSVRKRIKQSSAEREFWETATAVTTSDDDLSKGHAEYLEARMIEIASKAGRVVLENGTSPAAEKRRLPEADIANMEQFLANLQVILPVVGLDLLKAQPNAVAKVHVPISERVIGEVTFEIQHKSGVQATAVEEDGEFVVLEGSEALVDTGHVQLSYGKLKEELLESGVLQTSGPGRLSFSKPYSFSSPSAAAAIILDRNSNGRIEWKIKGTKRSYNAWQESLAAKEKNANQ